MDFARVVSLLVGFLMTLCAGVVYSVGVWGAAFMDAADWTKDDLSTCKSLLNCGVYVSMHVGFATDYFGKTDRYWPVALLAAVLLGAGYLALFYITQAHDSRLVPLGYVAFFFVGQGMFAAFMLPMRANALNWGAHRRGAVDGFLLGGFGISAAIFGQIYSFCFGNGGVSGFILFLGCLSAGVAILLAIFTRRMPFEEPEPVETTQTPAESCGPDMSSLDMLRTSAFWRIWLLLVFSVGAQIYFVQSAGALAPGAAGVTTSTLVTVFSLANLTGRFGGGPWGDRLHARYSRSGYGGRILVALPAALLTIIAALCVIFGWEKDGAVLTALILAGFAEGLTFGCWCSAVRDTFGRQYFGTNVSVMSTAAAIGSTTYLKAFDSVFDASWAAVALCSVAACLTVSLFVWPQALCARGSTAQVPPSSSLPLVQDPNQ